LPTIGRPPNEQTEPHLGLSSTQEGVVRSIGFGRQYCLARKYEEQGTEDDKHLDGQRAVGSHHLHLDSPPPAPRSISSVSTLAVPARAWRSKSKFSRLSESLTIPKVGLPCCWPRSSVLIPRNDRELMRVGFGRRAPFKLAFLFWLPGSKLNSSNKSERAGVDRPSLGVLMRKVETS
jgi:hypothetical protein